MGEHLLALERLAQKRSCLALSLTGIVVFMYFTFIGLIAFAKDIVSTIIADGLSIGIVLAVGTTVTVWITTLIYIIWANTYYDRAVARIRTICMKRT